jgi:hypothetical protein
VAADIDLFSIRLFGGVSRRDDAHDLGIGGQLAVDLRFASHPLHARTDAQRSYFQYERVAGNYRTAETSFLDARKQDQFLIAVLNLAQRQNRADLRQCLDNQHARHHRRSRKVALKKRFVDADLLDADYAFFRNELDDAID